jgi:TRAP-type transport system periplasmic protein
MTVKWIATLAAGVMLGLTATARADETTLIFATTDPPTIALNTQLLHPWADKVNEQGKGVLRIDTRDGSTLANHTNYYDRINDDVVQIAWGQLSYIAGKFPRSGVLTLPFVADNSEIASVAFWRLYKSGLLDAEFANIVPIMFASLPQAGLHMAKHPPSLDNLNGLKVTIVAKAMGDSVALLGGTPLSIAAPEVYESVQRGVAMGAVMTWNGLTTFKLQEVTTYHLNTSLGATLAMIFMTKKKYASLSPEVRKFIDANSGEAESRHAGIYYDTVQQTAINLVKSSDRQEIANQSAEEAASWRKRILPVVDEWVKTTPDGEKILAKFQNLLAEVKAGK